MAPMDEWAWAEDLTPEEIREECSEPERVVRARFWHRMRDGFRDSRYHGIVAQYGERAPRFAVRLEGPWTWHEAADDDEAVRCFFEAS
jgi:hypothetical protein